MAVRIIPARQPGARNPVIRRPALRVAGYCRVSTDSEDQESSYEAQIAHYTDYINNHDGWELAGIYADDGLSGTSTAKREQFNRMICACEEGKIDLVITKSISRWARNTLDSLQSIRKLKALGIPVIFEKENCNTMEASGELLLTILSSLAQQESQSISQNVRIGLQYGFQKGKPMLTHSTFMGYTKRRGDEKLTIVPEEADIVRRIFREFLEGYTPSEIKHRLERDGVKSPAGRDIWYTTTILSMLRNEKMMGDLLLQKSYVVDFLTKKKAKNYGQFPQYYVENAHEPIVPKEVYLRVQGILIKQEHDRYETGKKTRQAPFIALNGKILCGGCGSAYRRFSSPSAETLWRCAHSGKNRKCAMRPVSEGDIRQAVVDALNRLPECREKLVRMQERIQWGPMETITRELDAIEQRKGELEQIISDYAATGTLDRRVAVLYGADGGKADAERAVEQMKAELDDLNLRRDAQLAGKADLTMQEAQIQTLLKLIARIEPVNDLEGYVFTLGGREMPPEGRTDPPGAACYDLQDFYDRTDAIDQDGPVTEYSEDLVKRYIESITVHEDHLLVTFKAGVGIRI